MTELSVHSPLLPLSLASHSWFSSILDRPDDVLETLRLDGGFGLVCPEPDSVLLLDSVSALEEDGAGLGWEIVSN